MQHSQEASTTDEREEATKHRAEKKKNEQIDRFKLYLHRKINTVHECSSARNAVQVPCTDRNRARNL